MPKRLKFQKGFAPLILVIVAILVFIVGTFFYHTFKAFKTDHPDSSKSAKYSQGKEGLYGKCQGQGIKKLATFPLDTKEVEMIIPMGRVQDSHVTPTDHQYIIPKGTKGGSLVTDDPKMYQIKAPFDGFITNIEIFKEPVESAYRNQPYRDNYLVVFEYSCDYYVRLIHIDTVANNILSAVKFNNPDSQHPTAHPRIAVKEGEVIGTVGPHSFDFQIMDTNNPDQNIISPQNIDPWTLVTVDTFNYVSDSLKQELLSKNIRQKSPLGGKVGYDKRGTLLGNWFKVGRGERRGEYWTDQLSIVYDHIDESQIRVSLGNFDGYPKAFGVKGNSPDPKNVSKDSGKVVYELMKFGYYDSAGKEWDTVHFIQDLGAKNKEEMVGVVLFQLQEDGKLKVETFPAKSVSQVAGFTNKSLLYER